jgi:hypothetical protein
MMLADGTHNTNEYGYTLMTLMVLDHSIKERGEGVPFAHAISSKTDAASISWSAFGSVVKLGANYIGEDMISPTVLMSDVTSASYTGLKAALKNMPYHYYCDFHVAW